MYSNYKSINTVYIFAHWYPSAVDGDDDDDNNDVVGGDVVDALWLISTDVSVVRMFIAMFRDILFTLVL